jgi:DNA-binding protein H-NS
MAQTYAQIQRQIDALQRQAEKLRSQEVEGVVERIKVAISHYGLTPEQLGFGSRKASTARAEKSVKASRGKASNIAAYADGSGNTWGGRGPRPRWLRDALAAGRSLEDFAEDPGSNQGSAAGLKRIVGKRKAAKRYRDDSGNQWSGFGPKPRWLKDALTAGAALEQFESQA